MARPALLDDGTTVTLDLHGAHVDDALRMVQRTASLAAARGRATLRVVHGSSTSDARARNRTIKHALHALLDEGELPDVTGAFRSEDVLLLSLDAATAHDRRRLSLLDLR